MNRYLKFLICLFVGAFLWFFPVSSEIPKPAQEVFAIFVAVIASFLLRPLPMGALVLLGLISLLVTKTLTMDQALSGFGDSVVWLVVAAFLISGAVVETGFGKRQIKNLRYLFISHKVQALHQSDQSRFLKKESTPQQRGEPSKIKKPEDYLYKPSECCCIIMALTSIPVFSRPTDRKTNPLPPPPSWTQGVFRA